MKDQPTIHGYVGIKNRQQGSGQDDLDTQIDLVRRKTEALLAQPEFAGFRDGGVHAEAVSARVSFSDRLDARLEREMRPGDFLVVNDVQQCFRDPSDFARVWKAREFELKCCTTGADSSTELGKAILRGISLAADWTREANRDRTREGIESTKRQGRLVGQCPIGYRQTTRQGPYGEAHKQIKIVVPDKEQCRLLHRITYYRDHCVEEQRNGETVLRPRQPGDTSMEPTWRAISRVLQRDDGASDKWTYKRCWNGYSRWWDDLKAKVGAWFPDAPVRCDSVAPTHGR